MSGPTRVPYITCTFTWTDPSNITYEMTPEEGSKEFATQLPGQVTSELTVSTVERLDYWIKYAVAESRTSTAAESLACNLTDLKVLGLHLYRLLMLGHVKIREHFEKQYRRVCDGRNNGSDLRLRLHIVFQKGSERLAGLPWEFLLIAPNDDLEHGVFMAGERIELLLTRQIIVPDFVQGVLPRGKLVILIALSQPRKIDGKDLGEIDEKEMDAIKNIFLNLSSRIAVVPLTNPSYREIQDAIKEHKPTIVHYLGHGKEGAISLRKDESEDDYDSLSGEPQSRWVPAQQVQALFTDHTPRLVFLSACKGAAPNVVEGYRSTAQQLVNAGIPGVVAMQYNIRIDHARLFAEKFYGEIANGKAIDEAVKTGRKALGGIFPVWVHPRFATPVVYLQSTDPLIDDQGDAEMAAVESPRSAPAGRGAASPQPAADPGGASLQEAAETANAVFKS